MNLIVYQLYTRRHLDSLHLYLSFRIHFKLTQLTIYILQPSYMFTDKEYRGPFAFSEELGNMSIGVEGAETIVSSQRVEANDKDLLLSASEKEDKSLSNNGSAYNAPAYDGSLSVAPSQVQSDLVSLEPPLPSHSSQTSSGIDDLLGLGLSVASTPPAPALKLNAKAVLDPNTFQKKWRQLSVSISEVSYNYFSFCEYIFLIHLMLYFQLYVCIQQLPTAMLFFLFHNACIFPKFIFTIWFSHKYFCVSSS